MSNRQLREGTVMTGKGVAVALFTRDLRVYDNPVLYAAAEAERTVPLFVIDEEITGSGFPCPNRVAFLRECLADLDSGLRDRGGRLVTRQGRTVDEVRRVAAETRASQVHVAADVSGFSQSRLRELHEALDSDDRELVVHEAVITTVAPGEVTPSGNDHFAVFTPYHRRWVSVSRRQPLPAPKRIELPRVRAGRLPGARQLPMNETSPQRPKGGERQARRRLEQWQRGVADYAEHGDDLAADSTSRLSPYLHFGCLSPVELVHRIGMSDGAGASAFVRQVAWRDFHHQVLAARPAASWQDYRHRGDRWSRDSRALQAWKDGRTGYPIVDAGMRQLAREGWMHNRARLIVGSFLTKTLYIDWRYGAQHFLDLLVDGDIANNQMNWQWVAGTGTDTRPNRVLNPLTQAKRYDPNGDYVRRYVPELAHIEGAAIHQPWRLDDEVRRDLDYPNPIVDLDEARERFRAARGA